MIKRQRLSAERSRQLTRLLTIANTANIRALMEPSELAKVIALVAIDIGKGGEMAQAFPALWPKVVPQQEYYDIAVDWFTAPDVSVTSFDVVDMLDTGASLDQDFMTYLTCLTELHKRRRKYGLILQQQPLPTMVQVSPRALMEYGPDFPRKRLLHGSLGANFSTILTTGPHRKQAIFSSLSLQLLSVANQNRLVSVLSDVPMTRRRADRLIAGRYCRMGLYSHMN